MTRSARPSRGELAAAALVAASGLGEVWVPFSSRQGEGSPVSTTVGVLLAAGALLWWRRRPVLALAFLAAEWGVLALVAPPYTLFYGTFVPFLLLVFAGARWSRVPWPTAAVGALTLLGIDLFVPTLQDPGEIVFHWTVTVLVWSAGYGLHEWERRSDAALSRALEAERTAAEQAFRAVLDERARISRELHDIVAHAVSSIVVQAGAAEQAVDDDPGFARTALGHIRTTGNEALTEMRRLLAVLRTDEAPLTPQPRLDGIADLVALTSAAGPATELAVSGEVRPLPAGLDLAVYRIVQEALTNVRRHAAATTCRIGVDYGTDLLTVCVVDDGVGADHEPAPGGHGLVGMRERAALYGGELVAGPCPDRGYAVEARLPLA